MSIDYELTSGIPTGQRYWVSMNTRDLLNALLRFEPKNDEWERMLPYSPPRQRRPADLHEIPSMQSHISHIPYTYLSQPFS